MSAYDNEVLRRIASGDDTPREYRTLSRELATEVLRTRSERLTVGNLLAVIHRDGGHHMAEHGVEASCAAAERVVCDERARLDAAEHAARAYRDATDVGDGDYDATRHAETLAALDRVLGGGR